MTLEFLLFALLATNAWPAEDKHEDGKPHVHAEEHAEGEKGGAGKEHGPEAEHEERDEHGHAEEGGEAHEEAPNPNVGPGKAVEAFDPDQGFKLSAKAEKALGVESSPLRGKAPYRMPAVSLVFYQENVAVYRIREGWIKLVGVQVQERTKKDAVIRTADLGPNDRVVTSGVGLLRVTEMDLTSGEVGHGH